MSVKRFLGIATFGHLERDIAAVTDDLRADLHQPFLQARQRPILDRFGRRQRAQEIAEIIGERMKLGLLRRPALWLSLTGGLARAFRKAKRAAERYGKLDGADREKVGEKRGGPKAYFVGQTPIGYGFVYFSLVREVFVDAYIISRRIPGKKGG
jgi:hypothetical protein